MSRATDRVIGALRDLGSFTGRLAKRRRTCFVPSCTAPAAPDGYRVCAEHRAEELSAAARIQDRRS